MDRERAREDELSVMASKARGGDVAARGRLVELYMTKGVRIAAATRRRMQYIREAVMDGDDFVQEAWAGLVWAVDTFDPDRNDDPDGYIRCAMYRAIIDAVRRIFQESNRREPLIDWDLPSRRSHSTPFERGEYIDWLETHLSDSQKAVVKLRRTEGVMGQEAADRLGTSRSNVDSCFYRAIGRMGAAARKNADTEAAGRELAG